NGSAIARKTSFLRDKRGERIFPQGIDVIDDPLRKRGQRSRAFDAEGVATRTLKVIKDGVLENWFLDSATARELRLETTGHAQRVFGALAEPEQSLPRARRPKPGPTDRRHRAGLLRHRPDRHGN